MKITISHDKETYLYFESESLIDIESLRAFEKELNKNNHRYGSVSSVSKVELAIPCSLFYRRNNLTPA